MDSFWSKSHRGTPQNHEKTVSLSRAVPGTKVCGKSHGSMSMLQTNSRKTRKEHVEEKKRNSTKQSGRKRNKNCTFSSFGIIASNTRVLPCVSARRHYQADEPTSADLLTGCLRYIAHIVFQGAAGLALPPHLEGPSFLSQPCL